MTKKNTSPAVSDLIGFRPKPEDEAAVKFIQERLRVPGIAVSRSDALRRALHAFANELRSKDVDRRQGDGK
jgi:outer membrane PBP1 activator LpoA protein